jgi:hypothetical protein
MKNIESFDNFWQKDLTEESHMTAKILMVMKFAASE